MSLKLFRSPTKYMLTREREVKDRNHGQRDAVHVFHEIVLEIFRRSKGCYCLSTTVPLISSKTWNSACFASMEWNNFFEVIFLSHCILEIILVVLQKLDWLASG